MSEQAQGPAVHISLSAGLELNPDVCRLDLHQRVAALSVPARIVHRAVLRAFLATGQAPTLSELRPLARQRGLGLERVLAELVVHDVIQRAADGIIQVAYPFSSVPTSHRAHLAGALPVFAMCAIDALGLPFMAGREATILTQDPTDGTLITIAIEPINGEQRWFPTTAVVLANACGQEPMIKAECACPLINAFARPDTAARWRAGHPELAVRVLTQEQALAEARTIFEHLLEEAEGLPPTSAKHKAG